MKNNYSSLAAVVFGALIFPDNALAQGRPDINVTWQQHDGTSAIVNNLGGGVMVNNDPKSQVRIHVGNIPDNCWVTKVHVVADRNIGFNVDVQDLGPGDSQAHRQQGPTYDTDWISPPTNSSPFSSITDLFAEVSARCEVSGGNFKDVSPPPYKSGILSVPDKYISDDSSTSHTEMHCDLNGQASATAGVAGIGSATVTGGASFKHVTTCNNVQNRRIPDPTVNVQVVLKDPLPAGWRLAFKPATFNLNLGDTADIGLDYRAPTPGTAIYYIKTTSTTPNGTYTSLSKPQMLIVDKTPVARQLQALQIGGDAYKILYHAPNGNLLDATQTTVNGVRTVSFAIKSTAKQAFQFLIPKDLLGKISTPVFKVDGKPAKVKRLSTNAFFDMVEVPVTGQSKLITAAGKV